MVKRRQGLVIFFSLINKANKKNHQLLWVKQIICGYFAVEMDKSVICAMTRNRQIRFDLLYIGMGYLYIYIYNQFKNIIIFM